MDSARAPVPRHFLGPAPGKIEGDAVILDRLEWVRQTRCGLDSKPATGVCSCEGKGESCRVRKVWLHVLRVMARCRLLRLPVRIVGIRWASHRLMPLRLRRRGVAEAGSCGW